MPTAADVVVQKGPSTYWPTLGRESYTGTPWGGVGRGFDFETRLYYPFGKGPG